jgi:hydrogenase maturation protease
MLDKPRIVVLGVGNQLFQDEGVGVHVVNTLLENKLSYPNLEIVDGGTCPEFAYLVEGADKLIVVDAVEGGEKPGTIYRFGIDDVKQDFPIRMSLHQMGLIDNLRMLSIVGKQPKSVIIIGIEPKTIRLGMELSPEIQGKIPEIVRLVRNELEHVISSPSTGED